MASRKLLTRNMSMRYGMISRKLACCAREILAAVSTKNITVRGVHAAFAKTARSIKKLQRNSGRSRNEHAISV